MGREIPDFRIRYRGKWPDIIDTLVVINNTALSCGLGDLFLNGQKATSYFGGCDECRLVQTYQISVKSSVINGYSNCMDNPMFIEIEKGYKYQFTGNSDFFINFRIYKRLLNDHFDEFMVFFEKCFNELAGNNYNLILSNKGYINLIYVPLERNMISFGSGDNVSTNSLVWLVSTIVGNCSSHEFYSESLLDDIRAELSENDRILIEHAMESKNNPDSELYKKLMDRLKGHSKMI